MSRTRIRCLHISGESNGAQYHARVQTIEGHGLSPESMAAIQRIASAVAAKLANNEQPVSVSKTRKAAKRPAGKARQR
jgi:hypothetical protein